MKGKLNTSQQRALNVLSTEFFTSTKDWSLSTINTWDQLHALGYVERKENGIHFEYRRRTQKEIIEQLQKQK